MRRVLLLLSLSLPGVGRAQDEPAPAPCAQVVVFEQGTRGQSLCTEAARERGLTVVDLSSRWAPRVLSEPGDAAGAEQQPYLATYTALADERSEGLGEHQRFERHLELYGITPSFRVLRERLLDEAAHRCSVEVPTEDLRALDRVLSAYRPDLATQRKRAERVKNARVFLERARLRLGLGSLDELERRREYVFAVRRYRRDRAVVDAIRAMQDRLRCGGRLLGRYERGVFDRATALALRDFQREHVIISAGVLEAASREVLATDSRELVFRAALRALRERVVDATALIEDGSARGQTGQVLGRTLDAPALRAAAAFPALEGAAEDLVSRATEAAARALGWTEADTLASFFARYDEAALGELRVALRLPPPPSYHGAHMELRAELDRGDLSYAYPFRADGTLRPTRTERRPTLVLWARDGEQWRALARYQTTIGGWQAEQLESGQLGLRYKESPVGPRLWRDLVAAPVWLPPPTTPDAELVVRDEDLRLTAKHELLGPGYRSAYGLAMLVHVKARNSARASPPNAAHATNLFVDECCIDEGVRSHGSVAYHSILGGYSHGCHRLFNHLALRLMGFLLAHRTHTRHGQMPVLYDRLLRYKGTVLALRARSRGYRYELTPPVPIEVLAGRIVGSPKQAIRGLRPLRSALAAKVQAAARGSEGSSGGGSVPSDVEANPPE